MTCVSRAVPAATHRLFDHGGEVGDLMERFDWSRTSIGTPDTWPLSLRTALRIVLTSRYAMFLWWGRELIYLYNDAYIPTLGARHPAALGQPGGEVWGEIWEVVAPRVEKVLLEGQATFDEDLLLILERNGYPEETYFTFSYSPVPGDDGGIGGVFCAQTEETRKVIGQRQLALLHDLSTMTADARTAGDVCAAAARALAGDARDLPFAALYLPESGGRFRLAETIGIARGHAACPEILDAASAGAWPLAEWLDSGDPMLEVNDLAQRVPDRPCGAWDCPPSRGVVLLLADQAGQGAAGLLVAGLSPFRQFDPGYRHFIALVGGQIAAALATAEACEAERRRTQALADIDRAKTAFFSNVSHEFRTPLTLMMGPLEEVLGQADLGADLRELMTVTHRNALRLLKLVNSLLDFSRIEAGRVQAAYEPLDLATLTVDLASSFRSACEKAGLTLTVHCPTLSEPVHVDRDMWEKIVLNLLSNAFKFTLEGGIDVSLDAVGQEARLMVRDTGTGISEPELPRLFERFHRVAGARGRIHEGTGIGLALVQDLVRLHGGRIEVESRVGQGTTFTVMLPFGTAHLPADRIHDAGRLASTAIHASPFVEEALRWLPDRNTAGLRAKDSDGDRPRLLLADDNADMRDYVCRLLAGDYRIEAVADGAAALTAMRRAVPDIVLSDVMMPDLDGFGLLQAIRNNPCLRDVPVVLLSARAGEEARVEGLEAGADDYLIKPFTARDLRARLRSNLDLARQRRLAATAADRANRAKSDLLANVSHELRTPLNAIIGFSDAILSNIFGETCTTRCHDYIKDIHASGTHLLGLINEILDISAIEAGKLTLHEEQVDLSILLETCLRLIRSSAEQGGIVLASTVSLLPPLRADERRLKEIILNLLSNSVKFTSPGGRVTLSAQADASAGVLITVTDTGIGMDAEGLAKALQPFGQVDNPLQRKCQGTGLGLPLTKGLVELHGGTLMIDSRLGSGTTIAVHLPATRLAVVPG